jgi:SAM-dependent methyltransferase
MVVSARHGDGREREQPREPISQPPSAVVWHDLECGAYTADLALWRELAGAPGARTVLDIGAGTGRVALDMAGHGHTVTAVERDVELLRTLRERAAARGLAGVHGVRADARTLALEHSDFGVCVVPMQTIQLLEGRTGRVAFLRAARAHIAPGSVLACAIVTEVEEFDCAAGDPSPSPETVRIGDVIYTSRATRVSVAGHVVRIERERTIVPPGRGAAPYAPEHNVVELDRTSAAQLHQEGLEAGLTPQGTLAIPATDEHTGSVVVVFGG